MLGEDHLLADDKDATERLVEAFARNYYDFGLEFAMKYWREGEAVALKSQEDPPHPFAGTKVADRKGDPSVVFHGTLSRFNRDSLDVSKSAPNNDFGCGLYFTNTERDARMNYATDGAEAKRKQERGLAVDESAGEVLRAHLNLQNPVTIGGKGETRFYEADGSLPRAIQALHDAVYANEPEDPAGPGRGVRGGADYMRDKGFKRAASYAKGWVGAREFVALVRGQLGLDTGNWGDPNQINKKMEYLRQAFQSLGFDGIIDRTAGARFAWRAKHSEMGNYAHLDKTVVHYVAFRADQVQILGPVKSLGEDRQALRHPLPPPDIVEPRAAKSKHDTPEV